MIEKFITSIQILIHSEYYHKKKTFKQQIRYSILFYFFIVKKK